MKEKKAFDYKARVANDMSTLYLNPDSVLHCDQCHARFSVLHVLRKALFKRQGATYYVFCKACHHNSPRVKGAYKQQVEQQWKDLEQKVKDEQREHP
jgi:hypothetical protein